MANENLSDASGHYLIFDCLRYLARVRQGSVMQMTVASKRHSELNVKHDSKTAENNQG